LNDMNGIGSPQQFPVATEAAAPSSASRTTKTTADSTPLSTRDGSSSVDNARLSSSAALVLQALSGSDVRTEKVAALQQSIAAGTYNIPAADVAGKLIGALTE